jgi:osmotically-inducible protein OsmY
MRRLMKIFASILILGWLGSACSTTQAPKTQAKDDEIYARVKTKLTESKISNLTNVSVNVTNGVVTLAGEVQDEQLKVQAENDARSVEGVVAVNDNIQVKTP